ncbi:MAG TPA: aquaporin [Xanthobacteraceae bacterium]|nr:aquaporin [Xanthobacteraceae bacterium]
MKTYFAEFLGTLALVLIGCGAVVIGRFGTAFPLGILPIALAFGLTVMAMAYGIGPISGCHINPAVTAGMWVAGRIRAQDALGYVIAQFLGALCGAGLLVLLLQGRLEHYDIVAGGLAQNGWGAGHFGGFNVSSAVLAEFIATLLFVIVILGATSARGMTPVAGLAIGLTLTALHFPFINVTGLSVNPARSFGPAIWVGGEALSQLWLFLIVPTIAGAVAGWLFKGKILEPQS